MQFFFWQQIMQTMNRNHLINYLNFFIGNRMSRFRIENQRSPTNFLITISEFWTHWIVLNFALHWIQSISSLNRKYRAWQMKWARSLARVLAWVELLAWYVVHLVNVSIYLLCKAIANSAIKEVEKQRKRETEPTIFWIFELQKIVREISFR